ncbi:hypothetical protein AK830_g4504 [Neonectria ditissima]|uniref:Major facilitator superfamily (MFS) profile domain-containing protein n=1 Tax=Neonectria ditissima TaxID=78410 RepID=A0A0P7BNN9_9HYPO|nr:hypothetical protein AK830_g4504 [Neonectria ditissima]
MLAPPPPSSHSSSPQRSRRRRSKSPSKRTGFPPKTPPHPVPKPVISETLSPATSASNTLDKPKEEEELEEKDKPFVGDVAVPGGGSRAWLVVFGGFLNFTTSFGVSPSSYLFLPLRRPFSHSLFLMFIGGLFVGPAYDRFGARPIMAPGAIICLVSYIMTSFARKYHLILLSQGFLFGIRNAMLYYPTAGAIAEWFDKRRGLALGLAISGSSVGGIIWPIVIGRLLNSVGFAWTNRILAFASIPLLGIACTLVQERRGTGGHDIHGRKLTSPPRLSKEVFQHQFLVLSSALFFVFMGMLIPFNYVGLYALANGLSPMMGNDLLSICYGGSVVGRIMTGWIGDRFGRYNNDFVIGTRISANYVRRFNVLLALTVATSTLIYSWIGLKTLAGQVTFALLYGFCSGGLVPLGSACVAQTTVDMGHLGLRIGVMMALCSPGALTANPIAGMLRAKLNSWVEVHIFAGSVMLLGAILLLWARMLWARRWWVIV